MKLVILIRALPGSHRNVQNGCPTGSLSFGLTSDPNRRRLGPNGYPREQRRPYRLIAGHAGPADPENPAAGALPRARRGAINPAPVGRSVFRRPRIALPGAAAAGRQKVDSREMGRER